VIRLAAIALAGLLSACAAPGVRLAPDGAWDPGNPFEKIQRGELPAAIVYQDSRILVIMDHAPLATGHALVLSKTARARDLVDVSASDLAPMMAIARRLVAAQRDGLGATGSTVVIDNGSMQSVHSLHIHVIPSYSAQPINWSMRPAVQPVPSLEPAAAKLRAALAAQ
jgi:diadenosine tetraphosphate (Ap4A) HIT family hydrolase